MTQVYKLVLADQMQQLAGRDAEISDGLGCPCCGETRVDWLEILEDAEHDVHCLSCDEEYNLPTAEPDIDSRREDYYQAGVAPPNPNPL